MNHRINNPPDDDPQHLAGEYVLGTLSSVRRRDVEQALQHDAALRVAVQEWEDRLLPLTTLAPPVAPSSQLWARIERSLSSAPAAGAMADSASRFERWWNNLNLWRGLSAAGFAAASIMAIVVGTRLPAPAAPQFMVVLAAPQSSAPGWLLQATDASHLRLVPLMSMEVSQQKSLQLWTKGDGWQCQLSHGLVKPGQAVDVSLEKLPPLQPNQLFEITLEPPNGSPIGRPTGPILYIGRVVKMT